MNWNPFSNFFETKKYPHAQFLRSSFLTKLGKTFEAFTGSLHLRAIDSNYEMGFSDYLTGFVPYLIDRYLRDSSWPDNRRALLDVIVRCLIAAIGTLISSPFVGTAHLIAYFAGKKERDEALNVSITYRQEECAEGAGGFFDQNTYTTTLKCFLDKHQLSLDDLTQVESDFYAPVVNLKTSFKIKCTPNNAFFVLNVGRVQSKLEERQQQQLKEHTARVFSEAYQASVEEINRAGPK